ncbi:MAG: inositol monophosphatase family protein [Alphaproteobacteria bacterium]|jgi:myo-inositol-1(or 4)-monophosphatase|nr:inositol monophosphatase family protein [Alphaproteobacteria bacterium]
MPRKSALINVMVGAAHRAARGLVRDFGEVEQLQVSRKGPGDFVSVADLKAERTIKEILARARPNFGFLMEESGAAQGSDTSNRWIVDPLDGTMNFLHGIPHFATSIALERDGEVIAGVTYHPVADELFWAEKGIGAYLNDRRIRVSARVRMDDALIGTGIPHGHGDDYDRYIGEVRTMMPKVASLRRFASATLDLAYVAAGRLDGFWERGLGAWDVAAGMILIQEAGGFVSDVNGTDSVLATGGIVAANGRLHRELLGLLQEAAKR